MYDLVLEEKVTDLLQKKRILTGSRQIQWKWV
jgi:hypothetical protein